MDTSSQLGRLRNMEKPKGAKRRIALIDADTVIFARACSSERKAVGDVLEGDTLLATQELDETYDQVVARFEAIITATQADDAIICLSDRNNFRYGILPTYKANRQDSRRPPMLVAVRETLKDRKPFPVMEVSGLEADDVCGIAAGTLTNDRTETVICSPDKDLKTIPGLYYACRNDSVVELITLEEANRNHLYQTLVGDSTDCYTGCPKVGPKKAEVILDEVKGLSEDEQWARVQEEFVSRGYSLDYCLTQAQVARILRSSDWDAEKREVRLWRKA